MLMSMPVTLGEAGHRRFLIPDRPGTRATSDRWLFVVEQQARVDRRIACLRQREARADLLVAGHLDLDREPAVEKPVVLDPEVDVDQRLPPAVLAVPGYLRLEEGTLRERLAVGQ